jgi:TonB family protein
MKKSVLCLLIVFIFSCFSMIHAPEAISQDDSKEGDENGKTGPLILQSVTPGFPMKALADRVEGFVTVKFIVSKDGDVKDPQVTESVPTGYFEDAAITALQKYKFKPAMENGFPVEYTIEWPFFFKFPDTSFSEDLDSRMQACRYADMGRRSISKGEYQNAVKELSKAINLEPKFGTAFYYRSLAYMNTDDFDNALSDIDKAIEYSPGVFGYYNHRGTVYLLSKNYPEAIETFTKSITMEPNNIVAYINRGDAFRLSGKYEEAVTDYTSALAFDENLIHVHNNRGYTYYKLKDNSDACKDFKTSCDLGDCRALEFLQRQGECE